MIVALTGVFWDCVEAAELMVRWLAAHDYKISRRFADWPVGVRSRIVSSTVFCARLEFVSNGEKQTGCPSC